jgi:hypothetical protein
MKFNIRPNLVNTRTIVKVNQKKAEQEESAALQAWSDEGGSSNDRKKFPRKTIVAVVRKAK